MRQWAMAYKIIYKKRFQTKLFKLLDYLKEEYGDNIADNFLSARKKDFTLYPNMQLL